MKNQVDTKLEDENNEVIIKNYAYLFNSFSPFLLLLGFVIPIIVIYKYVKILLLGEGDISATFYISIIVLIYMIKLSIKRIHAFKLKPPVYIVDNESIIYDYFIEDNKFRHIIKKDINSISRVEHIINSETVVSYGKVNKNSLIKRFFKDDIGDGFIELVVYHLGVVSFLFFYAPIKIVVLMKNKEKLSILKKNLLIEFNDDTAFVINIYNESDYEKICSILKQNQIEIDNNTVLSISLKQEK